MESLTSDPSEIQFHISLPRLESGNLWAPTQANIERGPPSVTTQQIFFETCSASLNRLLKLAHQISFGFIERQLSYDLENFSLSTITCLLLSRKE